MCDACNLKLAPLNLTHLILTKDRDLKVACSSCLLNGRARTLYGSSAPGLWPARFYESLETPPEYDLMPIVVMGIGVLLIVAALFMEFFPK